MNNHIRMIVAASAIATVFAVGGALAADLSGGATAANENQMIFLSSKLSDLNVYNRDNHNSKLGNLDDLIINAHTGKVLYGILDTGFGGKLVPVPWTAVQLHKNANDNNYWLSLNKTQNELANSPTFDKNHWPDFKSPQWQQSVDTFFGVRTVAKPADVAGSGGLTLNEMIFKSSKLSDLNVYNRSDTSKKLGNLDNLVINAHTGQVLYGILDTGLGGKNIAVPWGAFLLQKARNDNDYWLTLNKTQDQLSGAPAYDQSRTNFMDPKVRQDVDAFFGVRTPSESR